MVKHGLSGLLAFGLMTGAVAAHAATVSYTDNGDFIARSLSESGVTVVGYWDLQVRQGVGISVVGGGGDDNWVDPNWDRNEYVDFVADGPSLLGSFRFSGMLLDLDGGGWGSYTFEGFDSFGNSVGTYNANGLELQEMFTSDFVSLLGSGPVDRLRMSSAGDAFRVWSITVDLVEVPEPSTLALLGAAVIGATAMRRRS